MAPDLGRQVSASKLLISGPGGPWRCPFQDISASSPQREQRLRLVVGKVTGANVLMGRVLHISPFQEGQWGLGGGDSVVARVRPWVCSPAKQRKEEKMGNGLLGVILHSEHHTSRKVLPAFL